MNYKKFFLAPLVFIQLTCVGMGPAGAPGFSTEDFAQEMRASKDHLKNMSAEERQKFQNDLAEATRQAEEELSKMSPEQLREIEAMVEQMMQDPNISAVLEEFMEELGDEEVPATPELPTQPEVAKPTFTTPAQKPAELGKQEKALKLLNNVITRINLFLLRAAKMETFGYQVEKWYTARSIARGDWDALKHDMASFVDKLEMLKMQNPKTNQYNSLDALIKNKDLYEQLEQLSEDLTDNEPRVVIPDFGMKDLTASSESAIKDLLGSVIDALYSKNIVTDINAVLKEYEPTAKKMLEEEEALAKKALEASKKPKELARPQTVGRADVGGGFMPANDDYGYGGYNPYYGGGDYYEDNRTPKSESSKSADTTSGTTGSKDSKPEKSGEAKKDKETETLDALMNELADYAEQLKDRLKEEPSFNTLGAHLSENTPKTLPTLAGSIEEVADLVKNIAKKARSVRVRITKNESINKNAYTRNLDDAVNKNRSSLMSIATQISSIDDKAVHEVKRYAYFGGALPAKYDVTQIKQSNTTLLALRDAINALYADPNTAAQEVEAPEIKASAPTTAPSALPSAAEINEAGHVVPE